MKISTPLKIVIGTGTFLMNAVPLIMISLGLLIFLIPSSLETAIASAGVDDVVLPVSYGLVCIASLSYFPLFAFYVVHLIKNEEMNEGMKIAIALGYFFLFPLAAAFYFLVYIVPAVPPDWALTKERF